LTHTPQPGKLLAAGDGENIWLLSPVWVDAAQTQAGFVLLNHQTNQLADNNNLWLEPSSTTFGGSPVNTATKSLIDQQYDGGILVLFPEGVLTYYGLDQNQSQVHNALPSLPFNVQPVAAAGTPNGLCVLGYGNMQVPAAGAASAPNLLTTHPVMLGVAAGSQMLVPATQSAMPLRTLPSAWWVFNSAGEGWQARPGPDIPPRSADVSLNVQMAWVGGRLWAFWFSPDSPKQINVSSVRTQGNDAQWTPPVALTLPGSADAFSVVANDENLFLLWYTVEQQMPLQISGAQLDVDGVKPQLKFWPANPLSGLPQVLDASQSVAATRDGDCIGIYIRSADSKLYEATLDASGKVLAAPHPLNPNLKPQPDSGMVEEFFFFGMIFLLALFLWQRKQTLIPPAPGLVIARLYQRFGAATIDMALASGIGAIVFGIFTHQQWVLLGQQFLDLLQTHENLPEDLQAVYLLGIYELHVTLGECFFGRSVGKWIFSLRVV
ncbi:MAG TPA: RDD family protein, partial [Phycisphaerae bacterium]|nr:RDD family protein [Phycisphaerae bacterium]